MIDVKDNESFRFISVNSAFLHNTGVSEQAVLGRLVEEVIPEPYLQATLSQYRQAVKTGKTVIREEIAESPSGMRISLITITPYLEAGEICTRLVGSIQDITERVMAEKKVADNSAKLQGILDSSPDIICSLTIDGLLRVLARQRNACLATRRNCSSVNHY